MPRGVPKAGFRERKETRVQFEIPDPTKYRISDCGMWLIEKISLEGETPVYAVWEYKRVLYGQKTFEEAVAAIKTRDADRQAATVELELLREPDATLVSHRSPVKRTS